MSYQPQMITLCGSVGSDNDQMLSREHHGQDHGRLFEYTALQLAVSNLQDIGDRHLNTRSLTRGPMERLMSRTREIHTMWKC